MKHLLLTTIAAVLLVGCGPSVDIHNAAYEGNIEAVKKHLANGADVNAKDEDGWSVLDMALASKNEEIITFIKTSGGHSNADKSIFVASGIGNLEAVQQHFASGVDVNAKSEVDGWTPLHYAGDQIKVAEFLISKGADVNAKDEDGYTPLHVAASWGDREVVELLIDKGANVNAKFGDGETPLDWAIWFQNPKVADLIRKHGGKTGEELKAEGK